MRRFNLYENRQQDDETHGDRKTENHPSKRFICRVRSFVCFSRGYKTESVQSRAIKAASTSLTHDFEQWNCWGRLGVLRAEHPQLRIDVPAQCSPLRAQE